ncbi:efflux RND transporter periplasmic adaptor subunit [Pelobacter seleniigenes]|uniref:efflux RND transporter periplasmic adaptor subunit n=1 Tax=Pelobacter seleniigenes TaxID=407188 RepID=UPI0004A6BA34|nr:efflux RND transporter periplasmic adaptor subunit [Pelobacter seleniigenes]
MRFISPHPIWSGTGLRQQQRLVLVLLLLLAVLAGCSDEQPAVAPSAPPIPVAVGQVKHVRVQRSIPVSGSVVSPFEPTKVSFLVAGRVERVMPREGDFVKAGQLLASLEPLDYQAALDGASAQVKQAGVAVERSRDEYQRMDYLYQHHSLARNDFEKYRAAYQAATQQLEQALAAEKIQRKRLGDTRLRAPVSGFVAKRQVEPGQTVAAGSPALEIVRLDPVEILVGVPERDIHLVAVGQQAQVTLPALPQQQFNGTVRVVNVSADPGTRTYMTRIAVANPDYQLRLGMVAKAAIIGNDQLDAMTLPTAAIVHDPQGAPLVYIYYPQQQRAHSKRVTIGNLIGDQVEISSGLVGDEQIVLAGQDKLRDGAAVTVVKAGESQ